MKLLNKSARVIFVGGYMLVPARPCEVENLEGLTKKFPELGDLMESGEVEKISAAEAKKAEQDFQNETLAMLKKAAKDRGLDTSNARTKQDYVDLLKG